MMSDQDNPTQERQPETRPETQLEARPETRLEARPETKPDAKPELVPAAKPETARKKAPAAAESAIRAKPAPKPDKPKADKPKADKLKADKPETETPRRKKPAAAKQPAVKADDLAAARHNAEAAPAPEATAHEKPKPAQATGSGKSFTIPDFAALAKHLLEAATLGQKAASLMAASEEGSALEHSTIDLKRMGATIMDVAASYIRNPVRVFEAQADLWTSYFNLAAATTRRLMGEDVSPVVIPARSDKRFRDPEWQQNIVFDLVKQSYLLAANWLTQQVVTTDEVDPHTREKAKFYVNQMADAISPSNFVLTNPEVLRVTMETNGENLVKGMRNLLDDVVRGKGKLQIQQTDMSAFTVGVNIATTPGKIVFQNDLMQLIQYEPTTKEVYRRPLLIFPPWINKYYILDLTPEKSFVRWATAQGYTVFVVSWVNPDAQLAMKSFESYMIEGIYAALDAVELATGEKEVNAIGYCIGGTLLAATLAHMAQKKDTRIKSATFFAAQVDFSEAGDLKVFIDEEQLSDIEHRMEEKGGYLEASVIATTFNMLRSNDLVWSYVVNNYLLGRAPVPFDLLYWNADSTALPAKMHVFYLRECYLENKLALGEMVLGGTKLNLNDVKIPIYLQSSIEDHIAPYNSVFKATKLFKGPVRFMIAGSGHIAGVINPPSQNKYQYWTNDKPADTPAEWRKSATEHPGSWWPDWEAWLRPLSGDMVPARVPGDRMLKVIEDAPGAYVVRRADDEIEPVT